MEEYMRLDATKPSLKKRVARKPVAARAIKFEFYPEHDEYRPAPPIPAPRIPEPVAVAPPPLVVAPPVVAPEVPKIVGISNLGEIKIGTGDINGSSGWGGERDVMFSCRNTAHYCCGAKTWSGYSGSLQHKRLEDCTAEDLSNIREVAKLLCSKLDQGRCNEFEMCRERYTNDKSWYDFEALLFILMTEFGWTRGDTWKNIQNGHQITHFTYVANKLECDLDTMKLPC